MSEALNEKPYRRENDHRKCHRDSEFNSISLLSSHRDEFTPQQMQFAERYALGPR
jgi:hypothetical protein